MALKECTQTHFGAKAGTRTYPAVLLHSQTGSTVWLWCYGKYSNPAEQRRPARPDQACKSVVLNKTEEHLIIVNLKGLVRDSESTSRTDGVVL